MKTVDLKAFRKSINFTQEQLADYLDCKKAFISAIENGIRPIPDEMYSKLINNPYNWDVSMLLIYDRKENTILQTEIGQLTKENENLRSQVEYYKMTANFFEERLEKQEKVEQVMRIELEQARQDNALLKYKIEMLIRGGLKEFAPDAEDSSSVNAV